MPHPREEHDTPVPTRPRAPRRVLYLDHTASLGGGEIALLNLIRSIDPSRFRAIVVLFSDGALVAKLREAGIETHVLPLAPDVIHLRKDTLGPGILLRPKV